MAPEELRSLSDAQTKPEPEDKNQGVEAILKAASNYPFRPDARHFIVLFTGSSVSIATLGTLAVGHFVDSQQAPHHAHHRFQCKYRHL